MGRRFRADPDEGHPTKASHLNCGTMNCGTMRLPGEALSGGTASVPGPATMARHCPLREGPDGLALVGTGAVRQDELC